MNGKISKLTATIGRKRYELVPAASCRGCAFERRCYKLDIGSHRTGKFDCPVFNDYTIASDLDVIFKEVRDEGTRKGHRDGDHGVVKGRAGDRR